MSARMSGLSRLFGGRNGTYIAPCKLAMVTLGKESSTFFLRSYDVGPISIFIIARNKAPASSGMHRPSDRVAVHLVGDRTLTPLQANLGAAGGSPWVPARCFSHHLQVINVYGVLRTSRSQGAGCERPRSWPRLRRLKALRSYRPSPRYPDLLRRLTRINTP